MVDKQAGDDRKGYMACVGWQDVESMGVGDVQMKGGERC